MDDQSKNLPAIEEESVPGWSKRELKVLKDAEVLGTRSIAVSLSGQLFELFLNGYSCAEIARLNKGLSEGDVLACRKKFKWDDDKDRYAFDLQVQIRERLLKHKLESIEFLTNELAVVHKTHKDQQLKYLQTGKEEDKPKDSWVNSPTAYGKMTEIIQKLTGEDRITTQHITAETTVKVEDLRTSVMLQPELQAKMLQKLASSNIKKPISGKNE